MTSPAEGLLVFNINANVGSGKGFYYWDGVQWEPLQNTDNQTITQATPNGSSLLIEIENGNTRTVNLSSLNTDNQTLSTTGLDASNVVRLTIANGNYVDLNLSALNNPGSDDQNLTSASLDANNVLTIGIENGNSTAVNLSALAADKDEQNLSLSGTNLSIQGGNSVSLASLVDDNDWVNTGF